MKITLSHNFPEIVKQINRLQYDVAKSATVRAVNRTTEQARTEMSRQIRADFNITASKVRQKLFIKKAGFTAGRLGIEAVLESRDPSGRRRSINLVNFAARQTRKGVTVKIKRGGGRKLLPRSFIGNQGRTVFMREGKSRLPIKAVQTIDVPQMFNKRSINKAVLRKIESVFPAIFEREVRYYTQRFGGGR